MKANRKGICIRVVAALLVAVLFMSLCPVIPSASAAGEYTLTFGNNDLDLWPGSLKNPMVVNAGEKVQIPSATMTDDFFVLLSWKDESGKEYYPGDIITPDHDMKFTANTSIYLNYYQVTYRPGAEGGRGTNFRRAYKYNEVELVIPPCPEGFKPAAGYIFDGWEVTSDTAGYSKSFGLGDIGQKIVTSGKDNYTMTAKWKVDIPPDYKITYHFNDPASEKDIKDGGYVKYSDGYRVTIKDIDDALYGSSLFDKGDRVKGCVFVGWSTTPGGTADSNYAVGHTVTLSDNLDLYAVWEEKSFGYTVKYHFKDSVDGEDVVEEKTDNAKLDGPIPYDKDAKTNDGKTYAFDRVEEEKIVTQTVEDNVIDVYYYIDRLSDEKESQNESDGTPDIYQKVITYKVNNGTWDGGVLDQINEIVTLRDENGALSLTGTAKLENVPDETTAHADPGMHYLWDTPDDARPTTVSYNDSGVYILDFFNAENALIIYPRPVVADYDGTWHTFETFVVHDYQGNVLENVTVTWKDKTNLPDRAGRKDGTPEGGDEINLETVLNNAGTGGWRTFFTISGLEGVERMHAILEGGTITINPAPVTVELKITDTGNLTPGVNGKRGDRTVQPSAFKYNEAEKELIVEYVFDGYTHTIELGSEDYKINGLIGGDQEGVDGADVTLSPDKDGDVVLAATYVTDTGNETTIDLTDPTFYQDGEETSSYVVTDADGGSSAAGIMAMAIDPLADGEEVVDGLLTGKTIDKITVRIVPRPVTYWTFGGTRIFDGYGIPSDPRYYTSYMNDGTQKPEETKDKYHYIAVPKYEEIVKYDGNAIDPEKRGFVVRGTTTGGDYTILNHRPWNDEAGSPINAGITNCRERITKFQDKHDYTNDYAIDYKLGYFTIYPQSITDDDDFFDVTTVNTFEDDKFDEKVIEYKYTDRGEPYIPTDDTLTAFYTGVKLVNEPAASYTAPYKFERELLRNENNAEEYKDLKRGTDYTVTYQRQNAAGEWEDTEDFSTPGTIQVTYKGIGNYRNRIVRTYELTEAPEPGPDPDPEPDPGPDVEINDHEHYAYMIGKPGGMIDPDGEITRAEIATIIFRLLKEDVREEYWSKTNSFPDVEITDWYNNAISTLENLGIVEGKGDGLYHPEDPITRAEMATMMARLYDYDVNTGDFHTKFDDIDPDAWYARYVAAAEDLGLFVGDGATDHFYPERSLSRAEAMTVYNRLLGRKPHNDGLLPEEQMILWPDNMDTAAWYYADVQEATNSHTCDMDGVVADDKHYELWLEPLPVRDWAALERAWSEAYSGYDGHDVN